MEKTCAGDIMIPLDQYPHVPYWFTLRQALAEMEKSDLHIGGRHSLPRFLLVFDEDYQLIGVIRRRDILRGLEPSVLRGKPIAERKRLFEAHQNEGREREIPYAELVRGILQQAETPVNDWMQPIELTVDYNDHIVKVIYEMNAHNMPMVPVVKDGAVVGVVRTVDIFHVVSNTFL